MCNHDPFYTTDGRCSKCYPPKRVIMVQHVGGRVEIDDASLLHQCGWCGEWYTGSRVDHGCPAEPISAMEKDYIDSFDAHRPGYIRKPDQIIAEAQDAADAMMSEYRDWQHGERGAGCAGNSADQYDSASEGHW